ncbi:hypothetical protein BDW71DRAFT_168218 [Aspergillus fruticulosus]
MPTICACWDSLPPGYFVHPRTRCLMSLIVLNRPLSLGCLYGAHSPACTWRMWYSHCWLLIRSPLSPAKSKPSLHEYSNYGERSKSPLNHTVCHATVFSYYAPSGEDPTSGVDIVKCGLCRSVRGFEQKTEEIGIIRLVGTRIKSTYIRHAAAFVNAALRSIQSYSIQWYQFHVFSKQTISKMLPMSPRRSARTPLFPVAFRLTPTMFQSECQISQSANVFPPKLSPFDAKQTKGTLPESRQFRIELASV